MASSHVRAAAFNPHFERLLNTIQYSYEKDAISLFSTDKYRVNQEIEFVFDDRKLYKVTPLNWAVRHNRPGLCKYLLDHGARPYSNLVYEYFPLHEACSRGYDAIVSVFIESGCDLDKTTPVDLDTPLHIACMRGNIGCVHLLLRGNANPSLRNGAGHTPLEAAVYHNQDDLIALFAAYEIASVSDTCVTTSSTSTIVAPTACSSTNSSHLQARRRHSLSSNPGKPLLAHQSSTRNTKPNNRPSSVYVDEAVESFSNSLLVPPQARTHSHQGLASGTSAVSPSSVAQPHVCIGTTAPSTAQLTMTQGDSVPNLFTVTSRPSYISQLSIASASPANSPSPVERDGLGPRSWTSESRNQNPTTSSTSSTGYYVPQAISRMSSFTTADNHNGVQTTIAPPASSSSMSTTPIVCTTKNGNQYSRLVDTTHTSEKSPGTENVTTPLAPLLTLPAQLSCHKLSFGKHGGNFQPNRKESSGGLKFPLCGSSSSPEFTLVNQRRTVPHQGRTQSYDNLYQTKKTLALAPISAPVETQTPSPSRERINLLSRFLYTALETPKPTRAGDDPAEGNPSFDIVQKLSEDSAKSVNLSLAHLEALVDVANSKPPILNSTEGVSLPSCLSSVSTIPQLSSVQVDRPADALREAGLNVDDHPFDVRFGEPAKGYMSVIFKLRSDASRSYNKHSLPSSTTKNEVLKVVVKVFNLRDPQESVLYHHLTAKHSLPNCDDTVCLTHMNEIAILQQLSHSPHPNVVRLVSHFKANVVNQYDRFAQQVQPNTQEAIYVTGQIADFAVFSSPSLSLRRYFEDLKTSSFYVVSESKVLSMLSQVLLGVAHLNRNQISHNAIHPDNIFVDSEDRNTLLISNFSNAIKTDVGGQDLAGFRETICKLRTDLSSTNSYCRLAPEVHESLEAIDFESSILQSGVHNLFQTSDSYAAARVMYELILGPSHKFVQELDATCYSYDHIPSLNSLSSLCNHLLKTLFAYDPANRLTALEGAIACLVLLFGPNPSQVSSVKECKEWVLAETVEFYMRPALNDTLNSDYSDSLAKLLCMYLTIANSNPSRVWDACQFYQARSS